MSSTSTRLASFVLTFDLFRTRTLSKVFSLAELLTLGSSQISDVAAHEYDAAYHLLDALLNNSL